MRAAATSAAAATSILRSLETTTATALPVTAAAAHLEPAFRILPSVSSLLSFCYLRTFSNSVHSPSSSFPTTKTTGGEDFLNVFSNKKITTLPQLSNAMNVAYKSRHYDQVLSLYALGDAHIIKPASKTDPRTAATTYDCALKACAAAAEARQAQRIISTMWKRGVPVGRVAQGSVLKALCAAGQRAAAFQHIKGIPAARVTTMHCNTVLSACAAAHDVTIGRKLWEFMKRREIQLDDVSYCEALRVFGAAGNVEDLGSLWENEINPALLNGFNSKDKNGEDEDVVLVQKRNESKAMVAAAYAGALAAAGQVSLAMAQCGAIMDSLSHLLPQELHLAIELETGRNKDHQLANNNTSNGTTSGGRQTAAPLDHLRSACNAVLHAAVASHQWPYLRKMVALMTSRGLPPDVITYNALLKAAVKRGEGPQPIHEGIEEMKALGLHPTSATYTLLIEAYAGEGDIEGAHSIFDSMMMEDSPVVPDIAAWNAVLRAHAGIGDLTGLGQTFQLMVNQGLDTIPDESTYITCFEGIATALRKHTSMLESINSLSSGGSNVSGEQSVAASATESTTTSTSNNSHSAAGVEAKKTAMSVLHRIEQHMKNKNKNALSSSPPAMRAALVKAHGALHHTAIVWSLLADEYIYNQGQSFPSKKKSTTSNSALHMTATTTPPASGGGVGYHALPPKPRSTSTPTHSMRDSHQQQQQHHQESEIERELLQALSNAFTSAGGGGGGAATNNHKNTSLPSPPLRVLNAGIPPLIRAGRTDLVIQLLNHLPKSGYCPDLDTYAALISACAAPPSHNHHHHHQLSRKFGRRLLTHIQEQQEQQKLNGQPHQQQPGSSSSNPSTRVYNALLRLECIYDDIDAALGVLDLMKINGGEPDTHTWTILRGGAMSCGRSDVAERANYELRQLKDGKTSSSAGTSDRTNAVSSIGDAIQGEQEPQEGVEQIENAVISGNGVLEETEEKHWKGYYASDEEDEW